MSGGDASDAAEPVEAAFDRIASTVGLAVEAGRASATMAVAVVVAMAVAAMAGTPRASAIAGSGRRTDHRIRAEDGPDVEPAAAVRFAM
ncbi:hypothetical protein [Streptosporangium subroseum]|uniref:hypothetical protein n=1 Tax=Streptosporangium subroseum TaxID=106412 RepID=UPI00352CF16D